MKAGDKISEAFWWVFIVFSLPSVIHIAVLFHVWDDPTGAPAAGLDQIGAWASYLFWWAVALMGAGMIDGAIIYLSRAVEKAFEQPRKNIGFIIFDVSCVTVLTLISWGMNFWYVEMNASTAEGVLKSAWTAKVLGHVDSSNIMPYVVSALPVLAIMYTFIAAQLKKIQEKDGEVYQSEEDFQKELREIERDKQRKAARKGESFFEKMQQGLEQSQQVLHALDKSDEKKNMLINEIMKYLRNAPEMLEDNKQSELVKILARFLKIKEKDVPAYLIQAKALLKKEQENVEQTTENFEERQDEKFAGDGEESALSQLSKLTHLPLRNTQTPTSFTDEDSDEMVSIDPVKAAIIHKYPKMRAIVLDKNTTVSVQEVIEATDNDVSNAVLRHRIDIDKVVKRTANNADKVFKDSLFSWMKDEKIDGNRPKKETKTRQVKTKKIANA